MSTINLRVNGALHEIEADPATPLVYLLRNALGLTGAKVGCALEQCGACAVLVDGVSTLSCIRAASEFEGRDIVTVEGLVEGGRGAEIARVFVEEAAAQCGYCTPGIVVATAALLNRTKNPNEAEIRAALDEHLCRCGAHARVLKAVRRLAGEGAAHAG